MQFARRVWLGYTSKFRCSDAGSLAFRWPVWVAVLTAVVAVHYLLFGLVHNLVDTRPCTSYSPDPLFRFIPFDERWTFITQPAYLWVATAVIAGLIYRAVRYRADSAPLRLGIAVCISSLLRMCTLMMLPLCRQTVALGGAPPLSHFAVVHVLFFSLPWRMFAVNDLVFSGHTSFYLIMIYVIGRWPISIRLALSVFTLLMLYGLLATREHYTVDILLAIPCSYFADAMAQKCLSFFAKRGLAHPLQSVPLTQGPISREEMCA